ncbi:MAG: hypothetical protein VW441_03135, partial [Flavobacteriaceae bacterium]
MKNVFSVMLFASLPLISLFNACSKEDPEIVEEQELITTVVLTLSTSEGLNQTVRWTLDSSETPTLSIQANREYEVAVSFFDESDLDDTEDITEEVREEAEEHQVFYEFSGVTVSYTSGQGDTLDSENNPLYINSLWSASVSGSGTVTVYLIHEPVS